MKTTGSYRIAMTRPAPARAAVALLCGLALIATGVACGSTGASAPAPSQPRAAMTSPSPGPNAGGTPAHKPSVFLLGGSSARESLVSTRSLAKAIARQGGGEVTVFNLGATNGSFARDANLVKLMPDAPTVVLVGVNVGRYTATPKARAAAAVPTKAIPAMNPDFIIKHYYTRATIRPLRQKRADVRSWVRWRYPVFRKNFARNSAQMETLIRACQARGFRPVLLQLPLNLDAIGSAFDPALDAYRADCRRLAARYDIPWVDFLAAADLADTDFHDLMHLVEPGRRKWEKLLAKATATILRQYGLSVE